MGLQDKVVVLVSSRSAVDYALKVGVKAFQADNQVRRAPRWASVRPSPRGSLRTGPT